MQDSTKSDLKAELEAAQKREAELRAEVTALRSQAADSQRQLVQAQKMASLGQLTAGIAHEIKNPLNFVVNFANLSQSLLHEIKELLAAEDGAIETGLREEIDEMLVMLTLNMERINEHGRRADHIVRSMMEHSRPADGVLVDTELAGVLDQSVELAYNALKNNQKNDQQNNQQNNQGNDQQNDLAGRDIKIIKEIDPALGKVKMMPQDFSRVIINILDNAFQSVQDVGLTNNGTYIPQVKLRAVRDRNAVIISIEDNGAGMSEAVKSKIFEPFFTTKPVGAGNTGLGLSLSYDIIAQGHRGSLKVESKPGAGAKFIIRLPA